MRKVGNFQGGSLPEFKKITEMADVFSAFTQANLRNRVLKKKQSASDS